MNNILQDQILDESEIRTWGIMYRYISGLNWSPIQMISWPNVAYLVNLSPWLAITSDKNTKKKTSSDCNFPM